jgi:hypothetical protein
MDCGTSLNDCNFRAHKITDSCAFHHCSMKSSAERKMQNCHLTIKCNFAVINK